MRCISAAAIIAATVAIAPMASAAELRVGLAAGTTSMDPQFYVIGPNSAKARNIFDGMVNQDEKQRITSALALSWRSVNNTTWVFELRPGVKFHDGSDLTAQDVVSSLKRVAMIRAVGGPVATLVADLLTYWDRKNVARYGVLGGPLRDPLVIVQLLRPDLFAAQRARVFVQHESEVSMRQTIADWWDKSGEPANVDIVTKVDADAVFAIIAERLGRYQAFGKA